MRVLHAYNRHRGGGGADDAWDTTIRVCRERGIDVGEFARDSRSLGDGLKGKVSAFINGVYSRRGVADFERFLKDFRPDVVHAHELYPLISPWILPRCAEAGVPIVLTCYDYRLTCPIATHYRNGALCHRCMGGREHWSVIHNCRGNILESVAFGLRNAVADRFGLFRDHVRTFIVLSDFSARWLVEHARIDPARTVTIPCALPMPDSPVEDPSRGEYVAFAGRFVPEKGVEILLEAARIAKLPVRLAGNALSHPAIRTSDDAHAVVTQSKAELAAFYRGARMLAAPSVWYETFGLVPSEAMSHGVPVLVSRIGAIQESVEDGVSGFLFEPGDAVGLAEKLRALWDDPQLCREIGARAAQRARERCSEDAHFRRLVAVYEAAAGAPARDATQSSPSS